MDKTTEREYIVNVAIKKKSHLKKLNYAYYGKVWRIKDIIPLRKYLYIFADFKRTYGIPVYVQFLTQY